MWVWGEKCHSERCISHSSGILLYTSLCAFPPIPIYFSRPSPSPPPSPPLCPPFSLLLYLSFLLLSLVRYVPELEFYAESLTRYACRVVEERGCPIQSIQLIRVPSPKVRKKETYICKRVPSPKVRKKETYICKRVPSTKVRKKETYICKRAPKVRKEEETRERTQFPEPTFPRGGRFY